MKDQLEQLFELTKDLLNASQSGDWLSVSNIQNQRESLCQVLESMDKPDDPKQGDDLRRLIQEIQRMENEALTLIRAQKKNVMEQQKNHNKGKKMTKAYKGL